MKGKVFLFLAVCIFFLLGSFTHLDTDLQWHEESFSTPENTPISWKNLQSGDWQQSFERSLQISASYRSFFIHKRNEWVYKLFGSLMVPTVVTGTNGTIHRVVYLQTLFREPYSDQEQENWKKNLKLMDEQLRTKNTRVFYMIAPSSENFTAKTLPAAIRPRTRMRRGQQLLSFSDDLKQIEFLDPAKEFAALPVPADLYYTRDFHWNNMGAWRATLQLFSKVSRKDQPVFSDLEMQELFTEFRNSDLYVLRYLALDGAFTERDWRFSDSHKQFQWNDRFPDPILVLGDSFLDSVQNFIPVFFADVETEIHYGPKIDSKLIGKRHWNTVILLLSEEHLNRLEFGDLQRVVDQLR